MTPTVEQLLDRLEELEERVRQLEVEEDFDIEFDPYDDTDDIEEGT